MELNKLREILMCVYRQGLQRNLGKKILSPDQAQQAITKLFLESLPEREKECYCISEYGHCYHDGFNQAINQIKEMWSDE